MRLVSGCREIETAPYLVGKGLLREHHDLEMARWFSQVADNPAWAVADETEAFAQGLQAAAPLAQAGQAQRQDMLIPTSTMTFSRPSSIEPGWLRFYDKLLNAWKAGKVLYNPATWSRNVISNFILADMVADLSAPPAGCVQGGRTGHPAERP
jgi:hypothetical protein